MPHARRVAAVAAHGCGGVATQQRSVSLAGSQLNSHRACELTPSHARGLPLPVRQGLEEVLVGMRPGAKRRALVPPAVGYSSMALAPQPPTFATKRQLEVHRAEPLLFEVLLLRVDGAKA